MDKRTVPCCLGIVLVAGSLALATEPVPVLAFDFHSKTQGVVRDVSGSGRHAIVSGNEAYAEGLEGPAFLFDGATALTVKENPGLVMSDELTIDAWLRPDALGSTACILDKRPERYRLTLTPKGRVHFGLKAGRQRADLVCGQLIAGKWHRVTVVFKRPDMTVYVDGNQAGHRQWDHQPDAGSTLYVGAKSLRHNRFRGAIDQVRLYNYARPPKPADAKLRFTSAGQDEEARLTMKKSKGIVQVDTGPMQFELDTRTGAVRSLAVGKKTLVSDNRTPPLFAVLMESRDYDGICDYAPARFLKARYSCEGLETHATEDGFSAKGKGALTFPGGDAIDFEIKMSAAKGSRHLQTTVAFRKRGPFRNRLLREIGLRQPLALDFRKRVVQAGDQGLRWDTRYNYQFHAHVNFLPQPDQNWWRHFYVDQESDHSYAVWRAESENTSGLVAFRGRTAPGWMTVYDREGGALFAYRKLSERAPKCLYVNADAGSEGVVYFHAPTHAALDMKDEKAATAVFGGAHETDWIFFAGEEAFEQPDRQLAKAWGMESLASDGPVNHDPVDDEIDLWNAPAATGDRMPLVMGGVPLPRGAITGPEQARLFVRGKESPLQANVTAFWPDRSVKWLLLIFPLDGDGGYKWRKGSGEGDEFGFRVTLRNGESVPCTLRYGKGIRAAEVTAPLKLTRRGGVLQIDTGPLSLSLGTGERWLKRAKLNGREMLRNDRKPQAFVDFLRPRRGYIVGTTHPSGNPDPGPVNIEKIDVEEAGPLRTVVRMEGKAAAKEPAIVIMRLEAYAGRPYVRLYHTVEFLQKDPRKAFVRSMGLRLPLALEKTRQKCVAGGQGGPVELDNEHVTGLRQTSHLDYEIWQAAKGVAHRSIRESSWRSRGWLSVADRRGGLAVVVRDMWQEFPKELRVRRDAPAMEIGLWPDSSSLMDVRRYSNYPHRGQGESTPADQRWVLDSYYKNDPFVGVTKTHEMLLYFHGPDVTPAQIDSVAADFQSRPLVYAGWKWYADTGITIAQVDPADKTFARFVSNLNNAADWWLFHQRAWGWYGMWDYGDVRHLFRRGYGRIFPPKQLARLIKLPQKERSREALGKGGFRQKQDYFTQNDWAYDNGRWGWSNTEGLPNFFISMQYLRTGRRDLFFFMEASARHTRDVDARHHGKWFGAGTRHGVQHWSDGNHEERQTTFTEQRFHYLLTGEHRTKEWNAILTEKHFLKKPCWVHAAHSGRSYGLLTRWEITGDPRLADTLRNYMHAFAQPSGIAISPRVEFPSGKIRGEAKDINSSGMFFHTFGAMHALLEYYYLTGDERVRDSIIKSADYAVSKRMAGSNLRMAVAFAARHAPDGEKYRKVLAEQYGGKGYRYAFQMVTSNPAHWTGETSFFLGNIPGGMFWLNHAAYVFSALSAEPKLSEAQRAEMANYEERPVVPKPRIPRESWQTEYDVPEFRSYLRDRLVGK